MRNIRDLPPIPPEEKARCERAAIRLKELLSVNPRYAEKARRAAEQSGDSMTYWRDLQASAYLAE